MGRGTENKGTNRMVTVTFKKNIGGEGVRHLLERKIGYTFEGFAWKWDASIWDYYTNLKEDANGNVSLVFFINSPYTWRSAAKDYTVVGITTQDHLDYEAEYQREIKAKQERAEKAYADQVASDRQKGIIRLPDGRVLFDRQAANDRLEGADRVEALFTTYIQTLDKYDFDRLRTAYVQLLAGQLYDLDDFCNFLMDESSGLLGRFVTWTGGIDRPDGVPRLLANTTQLFYTATNQYNVTIATAQDPRQVNDALLSDLAQYESFIQYMSSRLNTFYKESVDQAHYIAKVIRISSFAITVVASGPLSLARTLIVQAIVSFSSPLIAKVVNGSDESWADTLKSSVKNTAIDVMTQLVLAKFLGKIKVPLSGLPKEALTVALGKLSNDLAATIVDAVGNKKTFGEALHNLYDLAQDPESWAEAIAAHAYNHSALKKEVDRLLTAPPAPKVSPPAIRKSAPAKPQIKETPVQNETPPPAKKKGPPTKMSKLKGKVLKIVTAVAMHGTMVNAVESNKPVPVEMDRATKSKAVDLPIVPNSGDKLPVSRPGDSLPAGSGTISTEKQNLSTAPAPHALSTPMYRATQDRLAFSSPARSKPQTLDAVIIPEERKKRSASEMARIRKNYKALLYLINLRLSNLEDTKAAQKIRDRVEDIITYKQENPNTEGLLGAARNWANDLLGVQMAKFLLEHNTHIFGEGKLTVKVIPRRGTKGPEILDLAFTLRDANGKKIKTIIVEVKFNQSDLAEGQFEGKWFDERLTEMGKKSDTPEEMRKNQALAKELRTDWENGNFDAIVIQVRPDGRPKYWELYTDNWKAYLTQKQAGQAKPTSAKKRSGVKRYLL